MTAKQSGPDTINPDRSQDSPPPSASSAPIVTGEDDVAAQLRRRREASWRLPPLEDGHRDPLDALAGLPARRAHRCAGVEFTATGVRPCCRVAA